MARALVVAWVLSLLGVALGSQHAQWCDQRLKANVTAADTTGMLRAIQNVQLREFDYLYEQFYNPLFGRRQLGIVAQELKGVLPRAIGIVSKRAVGHPDDEQPKILENVHVFNSENLFMANIGATQELSRLQLDLQKRMELLLRDTSVAKEAQEEVIRLKTRQQELEQIAREAKDNSAGAAKMGKTLELLEKDNDSRRLEQQTIQSRLERLQEIVQNEVKEQSAIHRDLAADIIRLQTNVEATIKGLEDLRRMVESHGSALQKSSATIEALQKSVNDQTNLNVQQDAKIQALADKNAVLSSAMEAQESSLKAHVASELDKKLVPIESRATSQQQQVDELRADVDRQAGAEIVEQRRILEAQVALEKTKVDLEKQRGEEARKLAETQSALEIERQARAENATRARIEAEVALKEESALKQAQESAKHALELQQASAAAELEALQAKSAIARETAAAEEEAKTRRERENHDLHVTMERLRAQEARAHTTETIRTVVNEARQAVVAMANSPDQVLGGVAVVVMIAAGIYGSREFMVLWRTYWQRRLGQPSLARETSMAASSRSNRLRRSIAESARRAKRACKDLALSAKFFLLPPPGPEAQALVDREKREHAAALRDARLKEESFLHCMSDVVLPTAKARLINRVARSTRSAHASGTPLRHIMFYGPPGTGKTMVCRHLAKWCGLDYVIMSGADVAPLKDRAVTELHSLFNWAKSSPRGVLLFIDEADAFLASRDRGEMSESLRNALTALLFHTGSASSKIMLVLATNRPGDLDRAVLDRVDESVQFELPAAHERFLLMQQYYTLYVASCVSASSEVQDDVLRQAADKLEGFSGREIAKLMGSVRAHLFGREHPIEETEAEPNVRDKEQALHLSLKFFNDIINTAVKEHRKLGVLHHLVNYDSAFRGKSGGSDSDIRSPLRSGGRLSPLNSPR